MTIKPATRQGVKPLIGFYSASGCGKTMSSLLLARGLVGPSGKIVMIDTESGRGSLYADVIPGGYDVLELREPFSPARYIEAMRAAAAALAGVIVLDSGTHEWESVGGVQDMAMQISSANAAKWNKEWDGSIQFGHWKQPKMEHAKMMAHLLQCPIPIICCLRAKHKSHQVKGTPEMAEAGIIEKNKVGKTIIIKDEFTSPIQAEDFLFEMTAHAEIMPDHSARITKWSHPSLRNVFPTNGPITIQTGEALARWCSAPGATKAAPTLPATAPNPKSVKKHLWDITMNIHAKDPKNLEYWLLHEGFIADTETLEGLSPERLLEVTTKVEQRLQDTTTP